MAFKYVEAALADYLRDCHESAFVHFEYEKERFIVVFTEADEDPDLQYKGYGTTLGSAIEDLINKMTKDSYDGLNESS